MVGGAVVAGRCVVVDFAGGLGEVATLRVVVVLRCGGLTVVVDAGLEVVVVGSDFVEFTDEVDDAVLASVDGVVCVVVVWPLAGWK